MSKMNKEGYTILVKLPEECGYVGYYVKCTYKYIKNIKRYSLSMWLMKNGSHNNFNIATQEIDTKYIISTKENVENDIRRTIIDASLSGYFDEYIDRLESCIGGVC